MSDQVSDYKQLAKHYGEMYDEELEELAAQYDDLTDVAQQTLKEELQRRKLELPKPRIDPTLQQVESISIEMDLTPDGNVLMGTFRTLEEAALAYWALEIAGIPSKVVTPPTGGATTPRLQLAPADADRAQQLLSEPISNEARDQYEAAKETGDFESPDCPRCKTPDPLLESADPVNEWFCESCGHQWKDALATGTE